MAVPLSAGKRDDWDAWMAELKGPRKDEFADMNRRVGLTEHRAYLQPMPDGSYLVLVVVEGDDAGSFLEKLAASDHEFDRWFLQNVAEVHEQDPSSPPPPMAERML